MFSLSALTLSVSPQARCLLGLSFKDLLCSQASCLLGLSSTSLNAFGISLGQVSLRPARLAPSSQVWTSLAARSLLGTRISCLAARSLLGRCSRIYYLAARSLLGRCSRISCLAARSLLGRCSRSLLDGLCSLMAW